MHCRMCMDGTAAAKRRRRRILIVFTSSYLFISLRICFDSFNLMLFVLLNTTKQNDGAGVLVENNLNSRNILGLACQACQIFLHLRMLRPRHRGLIVTNYFVHVIMFGGRRHLSIKLKSACGTCVGTRRRHESETRLHQKSEIRNQINKKTKTNQKSETPMTRRYTMTHA